MHTFHAPADCETSAAEVLTVQNAFRIVTIVLLHVCLH